MNSSKGWIGVDLDGTLAQFTRLTPMLTVGEPIIPMVERVKQWLRDGHEVRIVTARIAPPHFCVVTKETFTRDDIEKCIQDWTEEHIGQRLTVTCSKDFHMIELWDDRCVQVEPNTGEPTTYWVSRV